MRYPLELRTSGRDLDVENLSNDSRPTMDEVKPTIFYVELACLLLRPSLVEKNEIPTIVEFPGEAVLGKLRRFADRRSRRVLPQPGCIDDQRGRRKLSHERIVIGRLLGQMILYCCGWRQLMMNLLNLMETLTITIGNQNTRGTIPTALGIERMAAA